ncbi:hypothetical protein [Legionella gresilensis]|uniref:hypothetical protein n=1 Tax=Legionella gresilensis TaxID=91823 RepID=UPI001040E740|nr:hypothetical protein [Legionella gresilensis]
MWDFLNSPLISGIVILLLGSLGYLIPISIKYILGKKASNNKWAYFKKTYPILEQEMKKDFNEPTYDYIDELVVTKTKLTFNSKSPRFYYDSSKIDRAWEGIEYLDKLGYLDLMKTDDFFRIYRIKESLKAKLKG